MAFVHPSSAHGVLVELKQAGGQRSAAGSRQSTVDTGQPAVRRYTLGDLELISLSDGFFRLDGGPMFGMVPKPLWAPKAPADDRNRITLAMRPLVVRGARTMIIDAGLGDKENEKFRDIYGVDRARNLDHTLAEAGLAPEDIDIVLATHLHFDHAGRLHDARRVRSCAPAFSACPLRRAGAASGRTRRTRTSGTARAIWRIITCRSPRPASSSSWTTIRRSCRACGCGAPAVTRCIIK